MAGLRVALLGVLLFCLLQPVLVLSSVVPQQNFVGVVIDDSRSMQLADADGRPRSAFVQDAFTPGREQAPRRIWPTASRCASSASPSSSNRIDGPGDLAYDGTHTHIGDGAGRRAPGAVGRPPLGAGPGQRRGRQRRHAPDAGPGPPPGGGRPGVHGGRGRRVGVAGHRDGTRGAAALHPGGERAPGGRGGDADRHGPQERPAHRRERRAHPRPAGGGPGPRRRAGGGAGPLPAGQRRTGRACASASPCRRGSAWRRTTTGRCRSRCWATGRRSSTWRASPASR